MNAVMRRNGLAVYQSGFRRIAQAVDEKRGFILRFSAVEARVLGGECVRRAVDHGQCYGVHPPTGRGYANQAGMCGVSQRVGVDSSVLPEIPASLATQYQE